MLFAIRFPHNIKKYDNNSSRNVIQKQECVSSASVRVSLFAAHRARVVLYCIVQDLGGCIRACRLP